MATDCEFLGCINGGLSVPFRTMDDGSRVLEEIPPHESPPCPLCAERKLRIEAEAQRDLNHEMVHEWAESYRELETERDHYKGCVEFYSDDSQWFGGGEYASDWAAGEENGYDCARQNLKEASERWPDTSK